MESLKKTKDLVLEASESLREQVARGGMAPFLIAEKATKRALRLGEAFKNDLVHRTHKGKTNFLIIGVLTYMLLAIRDLARRLADHYLNSSDFEINLAVERAPPPPYPQPI